MTDTVIDIFPVGKNPSGVAVNPRRQPHVRHQQTRQHRHSNLGVITHGYWRCTGSPLEQDEHTRFPVSRLEMDAHLRQSPVYRRRTGSPRSSSLKTLPQKYTTDIT
jgi:hypothetical protein